MNGKLESKGKGTLFIVPTPIGNLKDITLRALEILSEVELIACEDTRHTLKLLTHYGIKKPLVSYEKFSEKKKLVHLIEKLESGENIALVSDGGTPLISDPGTMLVIEARNRGINVVALPGACAFITALSAYGFDYKFRFIGFFPRKQSEALSELAKMKSSNETTVFYESPRRLLTTLELIRKHLEDVQVCIARELTKVHEEYAAGRLEEVISRFKDNEPKGEITVIIRGSRDDKKVMPDIRMKAEELLDNGYSKRDAAKMLHELYDRPRKEIYEMLIDKKIMNIKH
ncbi:MAG TPA: 16S rRNA (cytidine(1402)-2'-O)-methyltransferase [Desulfomonilia bacterium]